MANDLFTGTTVDWGFTATDIFTNGMALVKSVGPYVLLGIAVLFVPKLISIIRNATGAKKSA